MDKIRKIEICLDSEPNYVYTKVLGDEMTSACRCALEAFESFALALNAVRQKPEQGGGSKYHG